MHRERAREYGLVRTCTDLYGLVRTLLRRRLRRAGSTGLCGGYALRKFQSAGRNCWAEHPCAFSNTRGEALRCRARRGLGRESLHSGAATAQKIFCAAEWHRALSRLLTARGGEEASASNLKKPHCVPQASIQHPGEKGEGDTGKSEVSPRAPCA